jgi:glyoxylase-like metal-dependent hydrolase (beta-lactamase superfamily II)
VRYRRDLENALPANKFGLQWFEGMDIATRLKAIEIDPDSIDYVINSHLHIDHCGGNSHLPGATVIIQRLELEVARRNLEPGTYEAVDFDTGQPIRAIDGELDLFGDGAVRVVPTYGHTPGHQSVIVKLPLGEVLLAGDCCYTERNLDLMVQPRATVDMEQGRLTFERLAKARAAGTRILFGHDGKQWATIRENAAIA